ncbi:G patch domain-containing protein 2-like isoform X1 [Rhopilema esculentum]|uniref:G patch domain-containing protein 2-like isoform X1 n=1 Tax=Rhopilema esculentum TaxID=499914 RepID=UPI0031CDEC95
MSLLMEDLMKELKTLSSKLEESQSDSNSTSEVGEQGRPPGIGLDLLQMRNKSKSRRRRGRKRRLESHPELETGTESSCVDSSEDEAARDYCENAKIIVTDSDDDEFVPRRKCLTLPNGVPWSPLDLGESDSFTENIMNFNARRKKKIKKINKKFKALENLETMSVPVKGPIKNKTKQKNCKLKNEFEFNQTKKKKHSPTKNSFACEHEQMGRDCDAVDDDDIDEEGDEEDVIMDGSDISSEEESEEESEGSSSGSNEADDEGEESCIETNISAAIPYWEDEKMLEDKEEEDFQLVLAQSFKLLSDESKQDLERGLDKKLNRLAPKLNENGHFITYANKRTRAFLQHEDEHELCMNASCDTERDQIIELASLYSLHCRFEDGSNRKKIFLTKTRNTREPERRLLKRFLRREARKSRSLSAHSQRYASKRRKTTAPEVFTTENANPIPETNVGNQMLRSMGWKPGTGLGPDGNGIIKPIAAHKRPKKHGLGYSN